MMSSRFMISLRLTALAGMALAGMALAGMALAGMALWANAFLRPHPVHPSPFLPVARYAYPATVPTVLALVGGWWALTPRRFRRWLALGAFSVLGALDVASLWTVWTFFYER